MGRQGKGGVEIKFVMQKERVPAVMVHLSCLVLLLLHLSFTYSSVQVNCQQGQTGVGYDAQELYSAVLKATCIIGTYVRM